MIGLENIAELVFRQVVFLLYLVLCIEVGIGAIPQQAILTVNMHLRIEWAVTLLLMVFDAWDAQRLSSMNLEINKTLIMSALCDD